MSGGRYVCLAALAVRDAAGYRLSADNDGTGPYRLGPVPMAAVAAVRYLASRSGWLRMNASHVEEPLTAFLRPPSPLTRSSPMARAMGEAVA